MTSLRQARSSRSDATHLAAALLAAVLAVLIAAMHVGPAFAVDAPAEASTHASMRMPAAVGPADPASLSVCAEPGIPHRAEATPAPASQAVPTPAQAPGSMTPGCAGHPSVCQPLLTELLRALSPPGHSYPAGADAALAALAAPRVGPASPAADRGRACWRRERPALQVWRC